MGDLAELNFDASNVPERDNDFQPIAPGWYEAMVSSVEWRATKSNPNNEYLNLTWQILGPSNEGRLIWEMLNLKRPQDKAKEIAEQTLGEICRAVGVLAPKDSGELLDRAIFIKVGVKDNTYNGETKKQNHIKAYYSRAAYDAEINEAKRKEADKAGATLEDAPF